MVSGQKKAILMMVLDMVYSKRCYYCQDFGITEEMKFCFCEKGDTLLLLNILTKQYYKEIDHETS